jgi:hypothetical protein
MVGPAVRFLAVSRLAFELGRSIQSRNIGGYVVLDCYHMHLDSRRYLEESGE